MTLNQKLRRLDVFKKIPKDLSEGTNAGGCVSILAFFLILFFSYSEIKAFLYPKTGARISYDTPFTRK